MQEKTVNGPTGVHASGKVLAAVESARDHRASHGRDVGGWEQARGSGCGQG